MYDLKGVAFFVDTAFVASRGGWMYCDDSVIKSVDSKQVVVSSILLFACYSRFVNVVCRVKRHMSFSTNALGHSVLDISFDSFFLSTSII